MRKACQVGCFISMLVTGYFASAQNSLSFYHLGDATYQNSNFNPAYMPEGKIFFGLPALSGVHVHINNKFSYNDLINKEGNKNVVKVSRLINDLQKQNMLNAQVNISLFHFGYRFPNGTVMSIFANERSEVDLLYPKVLAELLWEGNTTNIGENIKVRSLGVGITHFREIGFGIAHQVRPQLKVGARVKLLQGFFNSSTPSNMVANFKVNPQTYVWDIKTENVMLRSSGVNIYQASKDSLVSHLISPGNFGFGLDMGFEYTHSKNLSFAGSVTDLGYIFWKTDIKKEVFNDTTFTYSRLNIKNIEDIAETLKDSIFDKFSLNENTDAYKTGLSTKVYGSIIYRLTDNTHLIGTVGARFAQRQLKMLYGAGIKQKIGLLTVSVNAMKLPQHIFTLGAALAVRLGSVQYYIAADQVLNFSVPDAEVFDFRTGLNLIIGRSKSQKQSSRRGSTTFSSFLGVKVKILKQETIYSIIKRQKKRKIPKP